MANLVRKASEFLNETELAERRAFINAIKVIPRMASICSTMPIAQSNLKSGAIRGQWPQQRRCGHYVLLVC